MHPILFKIGNITLYTYGLFVGLGFLAAVMLAGRRASKQGIAQEEITDLFFVVLVSSLVGARVLYIILNFEEFSSDILAIFRIWNGGLVFYGGFIAALLSSLIYVRIKGMPVWRTADIIAPAIALGHAIGRVGCFFAGCCYGHSCDLPWSVTFKDPDSLAPLHIALHPTQLYSVLSNLLLFIILVVVDKKKKFEGFTFWLYIFLYGIFRAFIEIFRGDPRGDFVLDYLSVSQGIGLLMSLVGLCMLIYLFKSGFTSNITSNNNTGKKNMPEVKHNDLQNFINTLKNSKVPQVFFLWGEEFICRKIFDTIIDFLLPAKHKDIGYELLEGDDAIIPAMIERLSTYSIFQDRRVVAVKNAPVFPAPGISSPPGFKSEDIDQLNQFISKGFPDNHFLVLTSPNADRRRLLFNTFKEKGLAVDCSVPKGNRKVDQTEKTELLRLTMKDILDRSGKGIEGYAFNRLSEMTGFDPATFADNLERLVAFTGDRNMITASDVQSVIKRTKKDAIFELNNAVSDRNIDQAIFYFKSLCDSGFYHLQLLSALVNHFRKILVIKQFVVTQKAKGNNCWQAANNNYNLFTRNTMPHVVKADEELVRTLNEWENDLAPVNSDGDEPKKQKKISTDLIIAPNPKNTFPVFQMFLKSDRFSLDEIVSIFTELAELDYQLKSSSDNDPLILLEALILRICIQN
ncbi:HolA (modular protein) [Desulfamplus magnetovallimortis]|uniref:Phosphatidylglycerol--prolipoprotein diacylglyceryl transferase n=1 Tax=Desulfamplus magnetovallimortis TaxID=1246637 RepID=A0A1W1H5G9_9BACT|nr:prolipoprotein diacylglyceryl transferase [Desulfamplus magnetovallimortis]SLM27719.1 HolA (modular protein) [Desulfamplus magnetovallimortis]